MKPSIFPLLLLLLAPSLRCPADTPPRYKVIVLPLDFSGYAIVDDNHDKGGINARGQIAGMSAVRPNFFSERLAALWQRGRLRILDPTPARKKRDMANDYYTAAGAVNIHGNTVGEEIDSFSGAYSDTYTGACVGLNGKWIVLGHFPVGDDSEALGINDHEDVVGAYFLHYDSHAESVSSSPTPPASFARHAFLRRQGQIKTLWEGTARSINNRGEIVGIGDSGSPGKNGILWRNGHLTLLKMQPVAINERTEIIGNIPLSTALYARDTGRAYLWRRGKLINLSTQISHASALNNNGQVVGDVGDEGQLLPTRAVLWQQGRTYDLNRYVKMPNGWVLTNAVGINDSGWIVGEGSVYKTPKETQAVKSFTFLLTPL